MARMKDLLQDLETYNMLNADEQKTVREIYNLTTTQIEQLIEEVLQWTSLHQQISNLKEWQNQNAHSTSNAKTVNTIAMKLTKNKEVIHYDT